MGLFYVLLLVPMVIQHVAIKGFHTDYEKRNKTAMAFFFLPRHPHSSPTVSTARSKLSSEISPLTYQTAYAPFKPNKSG